jgi:hypothetical protein
MKVCEIVNFLVYLLGLMVASHALSAWLYETTLYNYTMSTDFLQKVIFLIFLER